MSMIQHHTLSIKTPSQGLYEITSEINSLLHGSDIDDALCNIFIRHTSASLIIQENADPSARRDLERWMNRQVPEGDSLYTHVSEGPDDMPSHIKSILTQTSLQIPVISGELALGTWQGVYLWEHRSSAHRRNIIISFVR
jgi:secondary thiamine-phosphate synthase enzyme